MTSYQSVLVIDDHNMVVNGIKLLIGDWFQAFHHANDGATGIQVALRQSPQLVIVDYMLPDMSGEAVAREIRYHCPGARILGYSFNINAASILKMFGAGINGYVIKSENDEEFTKAVTYLLQGKDYFCKEARNHIINRISPEEDHTRLMVANTEFSAKEIEIIRLICKQKTAREIAQAVFLSERTVEQYRSNISRRIGARNMAGVIKFALQYGVIDLEDL
ncbi:response regulator [Dinghuibacter silviterrae]|uniref:LuxR family two component transcriptional regulator n=1 Tax=Dinghuibacter silviterrae TaxID=1539049 RepID=A0A4R8DSW4_9BACT|nr:response regulator transcription factor [Dinghuibacter silviterrae]TDX01340.1 LuxR family two component transcriptional regulator [Dinghuibacter silviterrae]